MHKAYYTCMVFLADRSATPQKLYGQQHYFQILSTFSYDIFSSISQPTPYGGRLKQVILWIDTYIY